MIKREELAELIVEKIKRSENTIKTNYESSIQNIGFFYVDDLLPAEIAMKIYHHFPSQEQMTLKNSLRENKYIAAQMNQYHPILEEIIYAFQDNRVVEMVKSICQVEDLQPDEYLYAGGISSMGHGQFLNPHLDNSHDKDRDKWRVLNLLYYVTPGWKEEYGGHLELWPNGLEGDPITIYSNFNRLVVMATHQTSWHSVSPVVANANRNCVSNYYFSNHPMKEGDEFHVTSFRGRPDQKVRDFILKVDAGLRMKIRKVFKKGIRENPHVYKKDKT
jgi:Rps23 Pro-64 3,4-dihydroxylase Tpa1-like proline 4-hydroxylase